MIRLKVTKEGKEYDLGINRHDISCVVPDVIGGGSHVCVISDPDNPIWVDRSTTEIIDEVLAEERKDQLWQN